jgi:hypothetical protein
VSLKLAIFAYLVLLAAAGWFVYRHHKAAYHRHNRRVHAGFVRRAAAWLASARIHFTIGTARTAT